MESTQSKTGRPTAVYRTSWGDQIPGLFKLKDGRWRISGPEKTTYSEADERIAVARFRRIEAERRGDQMVTVSTASSDVHEAGPLLSKAKRRMVITYHKDSSEVTVEKQSDLAEFWAMMRYQLLTNPKLCATMTGIEQLGYLTDLKQPTASPTLAELGELYAGKPGLSTNEVSRSKLFWKEFCKAVKVLTVRELTHDHIATYEAQIIAGKYAPKSILHRYRKVRTVLAFAIKRGRGIEDCRRALDTTAMLEIIDAQPLDPRPISTAVFWKIHRAATGAGDTMYATMILTSANLAMYAGEASALKWDELNLDTGEVVTRRPKTGVSRVGILWPETIAALKKLPRKGEYIFYTRARSYTVFSALADWRKYREAVGLGEETTFGMIRDFSFTVAARISVDQARVIAGHRLPGQADAYVRRDPSFVAAACQAIRTALYSKNKGK